MRLRKILGAACLALATFTLPVSASNYQDVDNSYWYAPYVEQANQEGIMTGTSETTFSPYSSMTRGMAAVVFHRLAGTPETAYQPIFPDVEDGQYYSQAVTWAYQNNVIAGYANGTFGPGDTLTREQMLLMAYRYKARLDGVSWNIVSLEGYNDAHKISDYAADAVYWGLYYNIMCPIQGNLHPQQAITRAESCRLLMLAEHIKNGQDPASIERIPDDPNRCSHINVETFAINSEGHDHSVLGVKCLDCERILQSGNNAPAEEHVFEWQIVREPTATTPGLKINQCKNCGYIESQEEIPATGENESSTPSKPVEDFFGSDTSTTPHQILIDTGYGTESVTGYFDQAMAKAIFDETNAVRARAGLPALSWGSLNADKANTRASELTIYQAHMRPNGQHALEYYREGNDISSASENIAWMADKSSAAHVVSVWMDGGSHERTMMTTTETHLAVGVFVEVTPYGNMMYYVQCFYD